MEAILKSLEIIATITGILAVGLQAKEKLLAWPIAILSVSIAAFIFFENRLYSDFGLHVIYIFLNIFGWFVWKNSEGTNEVTPTKWLKPVEVIFVFFTIILGTFLLGYVMDNYTDADLSYFDAFTTSGSLVAQYLLAKKYLQNWLIWIIVDIVAVPVYFYKGLYYFSFLFFIYLLICIWGYFSWRHKALINEEKVIKVKA